MSGLLHFFKGIFGIEDKYENIIGLTELNTSNGRYTIKTSTKKSPVKEPTLTELLRRSN